MTLADLQDRMVSIGEEFGDAECDFYKVYDLYLDVLIAIANRQCEGASSREFAKEVIQMELSMHGVFSANPDALQAMENRLAGKPLPPEPEPAPTPTPPKPKKAAKKKPKSRAKSKPASKAKKHR